jgi:NAD(P)-dependent dehydrogenase (short-subunit alcohol dehydrogenase family)
MPADSVVLVTGGSRGIGRAAAVALASEHAAVAISYRAANAAADETIAAIESAGAKATAVAVDLAEPGAGSKLIRQVVGRFGRLDAVVNNAGIADKVGFFDLDRALWDRTIAINLSAAWEVLQASAAAMKENGGGAIVNLGSPAGLTGGVSGAHYAASKGGLIGLTAYAAKALAPFQIRVNLVEPSYVETDMVLDIIDGDPALDDVLTSPMGRRGRPEEAGAVLAFLCSPAASYVSGARIAVSGAAHAF